MSQGEETKTETTQKSQPKVKHEENKQPKPSEREIKPINEVKKPKVETPVKKAEPQKSAESSEFKQVHNKPPRDSKTFKQKAERK